MASPSPLTFQRSLWTAPFGVCNWHLTAISDLHIWKAYKNYTLKAHFNNTIIGHFQHIHLLKMDVQFFFFLFHRFFWLARLDFLNTTKEKDDFEWASRYAAYFLFPVTFFLKLVGSEVYHFHSNIWWMIIMAADFVSSVWDVKTRILYHTVILSRLLGSFINHVDNGNDRVGRGLLNVLI